ncbi:hypothetical protein [Actinoplanes derwentensis]|uniref:Peptidase inhibitor family I36 n=1 Tax=Actinoplanes derwentensis TaxID=113562 RepID=A0A1H1Q2W0_9ACTN|nr:hypothetical protein [Actinoplanes derwentensis]GID82251.1 hypothetical protein Ade03nite_11750 [Actinoplanes derwentensis]SDS17683.1 hypothetical protein SAMN04489716_0190 [Actinoplanes derwentensis]
MRRAALYLGGLFLATGATLAMAAPVQAAPAGCRDIYGYGQNIILVQELHTVAWVRPYIVDGYAFRSRGIYDSYYSDSPYFENNQYIANNSFNTVDSYNTGSYNTYNSVLDLGGLLG